MIARSISIFTRCDAVANAAVISAGKMGLSAVRQYASPLEALEFGSIKITVSDPSPFESWDDEPTAETVVETLRETLRTRAITELPYGTAVSL